MSDTDVEARIWIFNRPRPAFRMCMHCNKTYSYNMGSAFYLCIDMPSPFITVVEYCILEKKRKRKYLLKKLTEID